MPDNAIVTIKTTVSEAELILEALDDFRIINHNAASSNDISPSKRKEKANKSARATKLIAKIKG